MGNEKNRFHIGPIRPPSEAASLLLQVTNGCTWNRCKFCNLYRHTKFKAFRVEDVKADIDAIRRILDRVEQHHRGVANGSHSKQGMAWDMEAMNTEWRALRDEEERECYYMVANWRMNGGETVFLQDGNTVVLSGGKLSEVLRYLKEKLPTVQRITSYGRAENLARVSAEEFSELADAGLSRIHSGFESGSDAVLRRANKGVTAEEQIRAGQNIKAGGIELSVYFMPGLGGKDLSEDHAQGMAHVVNECGPDFLRIRTCAVKPGTELYEDWKKGVFELASDDDKVMEIRKLVEMVDFDGRIVSDHIVNLLPDVKGYCAEKSERDRMIESIEEYQRMPKDLRRIYQLLRRLDQVQRPSQMATIPEEKIEQFKEKYKEMPDPVWDEKINHMISRYI